MVQLQLKGHFSDQSLFLAELPAQLSIIFNPGENSTKADISTDRAKLTKPWTAEGSRVCSLEMIAGH